ncbi:MAG: glucuronosyltransferase [Planctomycetota bacterium]|jgi:UDP-N-acetylglucosamine:LPS N-acetylglucosamine transferase
MFFRRKRSKRKVLLISSGGGHWIQLLRLRKAFNGCDVVFATVDPELGKQVAPAPCYVLPDANQNTKFDLVRSLCKAGMIVLKERPQVILSTGAAPGVFGLLIGKLVGADTIWIDSIANAQRLSLSGRLARWISDLWLTQWPDLARPRGPHFKGAVL